MAMRSVALRFLNRALAPAGLRLFGPGEVHRFQNGMPSPRELRLGLFRRLAKKGFNPSYIVDVGAHRGGWSRDARSVWPQASFTLVEPFAALAPDLDRFVEESPPGKARWINAGCGAVDAEMTFTALPDSPDAGNFHMSAEQASAAGGTQITIPVKTLNSICAGGPSPQIVKIDAEGLDMDVLRGATEIIKAVEVFFVELPLFDFFEEQSFHGIIAHMRAIGFEPYDITDMNRRTSDGALALIEVAFAKKSGVLRDHHTW